MQVIRDKELQCYHCGEDCRDKSIHIEHKHFCCEGCKMVYEILDQNNLCTYYNLSQNPGVAQRVKVRPEQFAYLDNPDIIKKLIQFTDGKQSRVVFYLPQMHCSSCIWLLENLHKMNPGVISSEVNFLRKEVTVFYDEQKTSLRKVVELLASIGYEPHINLNDLTDKRTKKINRKKIFKVGVAGFCFGNIMMLSFPEYFSLGEYAEKGMKELFGYLNLLLSLPVFFYSATEFYISAWKSLKQKFLNIDAPIVLAIVITFVRSVYEIVSGTGAGYLDSMSGIVFFMLIGRIFQDRTYDTLSFERDYKSYFPVAVTLKSEKGPVSIPVTDLKPGDRILIRNNELIPADSILFMGKAHIDYSFVTGESLPVEKTIGEIVYAGGKQMGSNIELEVVKEVSQSYLTQLWNNSAFKNKYDGQTSFIHKLSRHFTWILFSIAASAAVYWYVNEPSKILNAVTAVLIIACPCALLLSATFTNGNILRILGRNKFYLKNASVIEAIADADTIVFDKTGTITQGGNSTLVYKGKALEPLQLKLLRSVVIQSNHPLSRAIANYIPSLKTSEVTRYMEKAGRGIKADVNGFDVRLGSSLFIKGEEEKEITATKVYVSIDDELLGFFEFQNHYREGFEDLVKDLKPGHQLALLSGDNNAEENYLHKILGSESKLLFDQSPTEKLEYIDSLKNKGSKVMMIGDGLNDAGALIASNVGVAVSDNINNFSPACDAILDGSKFTQLNAFISFAKAGKKIIIGSFIISICYNIVGLFFAVQGTLSPVIAAILMPVSSVSIVLFTTGVSSWVWRVKGLGLK